MSDDIHVGDSIRIETAEIISGVITRKPFRDRNDVAFDPDEVTFEVKAPGVSTVSYVNGVDANVTKLATGDYACDIDITLHGKHYYYIKGETSSNDNRGAFQGSFNVVKKNT